MDSVLSPTVEGGWIHVIFYQGNSFCKKLCLSNVIKIFTHVAFHMTVFKKCFMNANYGGQEFCIMKECFKVPHRVVLARSSIGGHGG